MLRRTQRPSLGWAMSHEGKQVFATPDLVPLHGTDEKPEPQKGKTHSQGIQVASSQARPGLRPSELRLSPSLCHEGSSRPQGPESQ